jgi:hypothetical protein
MRRLLDDLHIHYPRSDSIFAVPEIVDHTQHMFFRFRSKSHPSTAHYTILMDNFTSDGFTSLLTNSFDDSFTYPCELQCMKYFIEGILLVFRFHFTLTTKDTILL